MGIISNTLNRWKEAAREAALDIASNVFHGPIVSKKMDISLYGQTAIVGFHIAVPDKREKGAFSRTYSIFEIVGAGKVSLREQGMVALDNNSLSQQQVSFVDNRSIAKSELNRLGWELGGHYTVSSSNAKHQFVNHAIRTLTQAVRAQPAASGAQFALA